MNNKGSVELIIVMVVCGVALAISIPIFFMVIGTMDTYEVPVDTNFAFAGIAIIMVGLALVFVKYTSKEEENETNSYTVDTNDIAIEPSTKSIRDAKKILKIRYAKGEINSKEYTERMSRL